MKKIRLLVMILIVVFMILIGKTVYATDESESQKLLYQDITINTDGSITIKEAMWLNGTYNGANRKIKFKKSHQYPFTGIYSNFSGDTDIYDATEVSDIKVFDISQSNFNSINDINNIENEFKKVENASKGKYGVYTVTPSKYNSQVTIYCPSKKQKVFYLEYTIKDAVVIHNDIAELYWCFVENESSETILDYQAIVHLPQEDNKVMVWSHGPATGSCRIVNDKTLSLTDTNIAPYKSETLRVMFDKTLVPQATKISNVNGKEYIIQYENAMANPTTSKEETEKINIENQLSQAFIELDEKTDIYWYNKANELIQRITWDDILKQEYQKKLNSMKETVNQNWREYVEREYEVMLKYNNISQSRIQYLIRKIDEGFDEEAKREYYAKANELQNQLNENRLAIKQRILQMVAILYLALGVLCLLVLLKVFLEKRTYHKTYYRDFPSEDNAYILDYLMNKKITAKTFSVTILDLIVKKMIKLERKSDLEKDFCFVLQEGNFSRTMVEDTVIEILFNVVGNNNRCYLSNLKNYRKTITNSTDMISHFKEFGKNILKEIKHKEYFKKDNKYSNLLKITPIIIGSISFVLGFFISQNGYIGVLNYYVLITVLSILCYKILSLDKRRTKKGSTEYSKWLAHKRFLNDFGNFDQKELPEIILWDRYLVTATVLGCSNKVLKQMKIYVNSYEEMEETQDFLSNYMRYQTIKQLDRSINSLMHRAKLESAIEKASSSNGDSYSSGSGFGGGSSGGGSGGGGGGWSRF